MVFKFELPKFLVNLDMFGARVPSFNLRKQETVNTSFGAVTSITITLLTFMFALLKV